MKYISYACLSLMIMASSLNAAPKKSKGGKAKAAPAAAAPADPAASAAPAASSMEASSEPAMAATDDAPYGMAGCGLGSVIIKNKFRGPQIGAFFLNALFGSQTSAITSGTSNCVHSKSEMASVEQKVFVIANLSSLSKEAAQGGGDHLNGLAEIFGCGGEEPRVRLGQLSQEKFDEIFADQRAETVLQNFKSAIHADPLLAPECTLAS